VIANRANELAWRKLGAKATGAQRSRNMSQRQNDSFPTRITSQPRRISCRSFRRSANFTAALRKKEKAFARIVQDRADPYPGRTPRTLGQEFSGYAARSRAASRGFRVAVRDLYRWRKAAPPSVPASIRAEIARTFARHVAKITKLPFTSAPQQIRGAGSNEPTYSRTAYQFGGDWPVQDRKRYPLLGSGPAFRPR